MKKTFYTLALGSILLTGCSQEEHLATGEPVQMTFTANIDTGVQSRSEEGNAVSVDKLIGIICQQTEDNGVTSLGSELIRDTVEVDKATGKATFAPILVKGKKYGIVFWAYNSESTNAVDTKNLSAITFSADNDPIFYTHTLEDVTTESSGSVTLTRPLAQINFATTASDWDIVESLGETPSKATLVLTECSNSYNALQGTYSGNETFTYEVDLEENTKLGDYILLGQGYTFPECTPNCSISVKNDNDKVIYTLKVPSVPTTANYRTNIVPQTSTDSEGNKTGGLMTGSVSYEVTITEGYQNTTNKNPEELQEEAKNNNSENNE